MTHLQALASFILGVIIFSGAAAAQQLNSYSVEANIISQSVTEVKMVMTFMEPTDKFQLLLPISISDFQATSTAGPVACNNEIGGPTSLISCSMNLTAEKKTLEMSFKTPDLVKQRGTSFVFAGDFNVKVPAKDVLVAVRLPEGMFLSQNVPGGSTVPFSNSTSTDGRKITIVWRLANTDQRPLSFQVYYEPGVNPDAFFANPPLRIIAVIGIVVVGGIGILFLRRRRETKQVVFSVLDNFERSVISSIEKAGGTINQKRIVQDTNFSKAKVSRVVQKLAERGLVQVERRGRTNIVRFLKKKLES